MENKCNAISKIIRIKNQPNINVFLVLWLAKTREIRMKKFQKKNLLFSQSELLKQIVFPTKTQFLDIIF